MIGGKMIGHRPISTSQHHPGAQRRQLRTGAIEAEQGQRGHGGRKPGKGMNLATSPQNECENRRRRPSRGLAHTPGTPIFALFRWTSERAASIRCPDGGSGQGSFASFLKGPLPPSGHRIERGTIDLQSDINCLPERSLLGAFGKQHDDYDHDVFNSAGSTLATPHFGPENGVHLTHPSNDLPLTTGPHPGVCELEKSAFAGNCTVSVSSYNWCAVMRNGDVAEVLGCLTVEFVGYFDFFISDSAHPISDVGLARRVNGTAWPTDKVVMPQ